MGMLERIKKKMNEGFKEFVINMETTGGANRAQIFTAGVLEDPVFMSFVMKNIRTFDDFLTLDSGEIETVLSSQEQMMTLFAKCFSGEPVSKVLALEATIPRFVSRLKDELSYLKDVTPQEKQGAKFHILKMVRKYQMEDLIRGFPWTLPPQDVYYPKQIKDGLHQIYFENGVLAAEGLYRSGKRSGTWKHMYDGGELLAQGSYLEGMKTEMWVFYYRNGKMKSEGNYSQDLKHGIWKDWDRNGNCLETEYNDGVKKLV